MSDRSPSRRRVLSGALAAALSTSAGCLGALRGSGADGSPDGADRSLVLTLFRDGDSLREKFVVDLADTRPEWDEEAFETTRNVTAYTSRYRKPFLSHPEDPTYTERDGTYYRLGSVVVDEAPVTHPVLRLTDVGSVDDSGTPDGVALSELPEADRRAARIAYFAARARDNEGGAPWGMVQRGGYVYRRDEAVDGSDLLADDGPDHVVYRDRVYAVAVAREEFHEPVYRATVDPVAGSPERMEAILRAQFVDARLSRDDLSAAAREVVRTARNDGHSETHPYSSGYREVLRAIHARAYIDGNVRKDAGVDESGRRMLRYGDVYYDYRLRFRDDGGGS